LKKPESPKERNLVKGALRLVFSRSDVRREALSRQLIEHSDPNHPRVTKWAWCAECGEIQPAYKMEVDHVSPVIPMDKELGAMSWEEVINRLWCGVEFLQVVDKECHKRKSKEENKARREYKKGRK